MASSHAEAEEISQKLIDYEKVAQKSKNAAELLYLAAKSALSAAEDLKKTVGVEKGIDDEFASCADRMTKDAKKALLAADKLLNCAVCFSVEVRKAKKQMGKEEAKLPPISLVNTDCTTEPTGVESRVKGRRYQ